MKSALVLLSLVALSQAGVPTPRALDGKIVNGEAVELGEIPYQVSLQSLAGFHFCGGSIINKNYVITAAHCVYLKRPVSVKVIAGTIDLDDPKSTHYVDKIYFHENYDTLNTWINDIALLKVIEEFQVSETISFVPLPEPNQHVPVDSVAVVSGWGDIEFGGPSTNNLLRAEIYIQNHDSCAEVYAPIRYTVHESTICANNPTVMTGACHGDSGGPLTIDGKIVGIVSWSHECALLKYPTVYTRVADYIDWIESHAV